MYRSFFLHFFVLSFICKLIRQTFINLIFIISLCHTKRKMSSSFRFMFLRKCILCIKMIFEQVSQRQSSCISPQASCCSSNSATLLVSSVTGILDNRNLLYVLLARENAKCFSRIKDKNSKDWSTWFLTQFDLKEDGNCKSRNVLF